MSFDPDYYDPIEDNICPYCGGDIDWEDGVKVDERSGIASDFDIFLCECPRCKHEVIMAEEFDSTYYAHYAIRKEMFYDVSKPSFNRRNASSIKPSAKMKKPFLTNKRRRR